MSIELRVPEVGESISEVEIGEWRKQEGDFVERDDEVVIIETDKATVEVPAPQSGTITKILKRSGQKAAVHEVIAYIEAAQSTASKPRAAETAAEDRQAVTAENKETAAARSPAAAERAPDDDRSLSPLTRGTDMQSAAPAGDRLREQSERAPVQTSEVVEAAAEAGTETLPEQEALPEREFEEKHQSRAAEKTLRKTRGPEQARAEFGPESRERSIDRTEKSVPMSRLRRRIAERLVNAQQNAALLTTFNEIDMTAVIELRKRYRDWFREQYQTKLGFMSFFVKAAIEALRLVPEVNAEIRGNEIVYRNFFDIGIAVGGGEALVVPVLRNAERLSFADIERAIADFATRAEQSRLAPAELQGGTFTISNGGIYGSLLSTPIVNPPQSGILGLHAIKERPIALDGAVVVRPMMYTALTYDHRLIDGREAVKFLIQVKEIIENPARMLLGA